MSTRRFSPFTSSLFALLGVLGLAACDGGFATQDAVAQCEIDKANSTSVTEASFAACVACYEKCGLECKALGRTPEEYACPSE
jgi:hypothetical protein